MARKKRKDAADEELLAPDAFETAGAQGVSWFESNFVYLVIGVVAILAAVVFVEYRSASILRSQSEVTAALNEVVETFNEAVDLRTVLTSTSTEKVTRDYRAAQQKVSAFRAQYADLPAAALAALYEAELLRRLDEPAKAIPLYEAYLNEFGADGTLSFMAYEGAGYAHETLGQLDQALSMFEKLANYKFVKGYALKHQARVLEAKGEKERALAAYRELSELDATSPLKAFADGRIRELE